MAGACVSRIFDSPLVATCHFARFFRHVANIQPVDLTNFYLQLTLILLAETSLAPSHILCFYVRRIDVDERQARVHVRNIPWILRHAHAIKDAG